MKALRIDGRLTKVFVLKETEDSIVYIPLTHLGLIDYKRLIDIESQGGEMLTAMRKTTLDNGRNALQQYDDVIQVLRYSSKDAGIRVPKPTEGMSVHEKYEKKQKEIDEEKSKKESQSTEGVTAEAPVRRKPGPKPGSKRKAPSDTSE